MAVPTVGDWVDGWEWSSVSTVARLLVAPPVAKKAVLWEIEKVGEMAVWRADDWEDNWAESWVG